MSALQHRMEGLSETKRRLLAHWVHNRSPEGASGSDQGTQEQASPQRRTRLVAYVVLTSSAEGNRSASSSSEVSELRAYLKEKLPGYMVPDAIVTLDALPRMPNGKINLQNLPDPRGAESDSELTYVAPRNAMETTLAKIWSELLGVELVGVHDDFFEIGGDSIVSIQIISRAREAGIHLEPKHMVDHATIADLASVVRASSESPVDQGPVTGEVPLTPIQHWFFGLNLEAPHHWNQSALYEVPADLDENILKQAVAHCVGYHDALRIRYARDASGWRQFVADVEEGETPFSVVDLSHVAEVQLSTALEQHVDRAQGSFDLAVGTLVRFVLFKRGNHLPAILLITVHHLVVDVISWHILIEDFERSYQSLSEGGSIPAREPTTAYGRWAQGLVHYAQSQELQAEMQYWSTPPAAEIADVPVDFAHEGTGTEASAQTVSVFLDSERTQDFLTRAHAAYHTRPNDLLVTAVVQAFCNWTGDRSLRLGVEGHGREPVMPGIDVSRTVGWFTSFFPMTLNLENAGDPGASIKSIKEQLRGVPNRGLGYGVLRYLRENRSAEARLLESPPAQVLFNYLGPIGQSGSNSLLCRIPRAVATARHPENERSHLLEINAVVIDGKLKVDWIYSHSVHRRETIERVAGTLIEALTSLIEHCTSSGVGGFTPSDFPEAGMSQDELDRFLGELG